MEVGGGNRWRSGEKGRRERASYFARREAARVLRCVLRGDSQKKAVASIKSLVYTPSVRNKKATFALVCQTLKHLSLLKKILAATNILTGKLKRQKELVYTITYDVLFGQATTLVGVAEQFVLSKKAMLQLALTKLCAKENVNDYTELLAVDNNGLDGSKLRFVRVNTLKMDVNAAISELEKEYEVIQDDLVPNLLALPSGVDLHDHPLVTSGRIFFQGKSSCMPAVALNPEPGWEVIDACSAPGNKTIQIAALMKGMGKIIACELDRKRGKILADTIKRSGAQNIEVHNIDFLKVDSSMHSKVRAILLDPSCSGSGTSTNRLDYLLPSYGTGRVSNAIDCERARKLSAFQKKALAHALSFPSVERVVYSTCSVYQEENEDVIRSVLPLAESLNFQLAPPFPQWPRRGLPVFDGAENLLRTTPDDGMEGFFIALFIRKNPQKLMSGLEDAFSKAITSQRQNSGVVQATNGQIQCHNHLKTRRARKKSVLVTNPFLKCSRALLFACLIRQKRACKRQRYK